IQGSVTLKTFKDQKYRVYGVNTAGGNVFIDEIKTGKEFTLTVNNKMDVAFFVKPYIPVPTPTPTPVPTQPPPDPGGCPASVFGEDGGRGTDNFGFMFSLIFGGLFFIGLVWMVRKLRLIHKYYGGV
ncbi:MAG: hypothetical protein ACTSRU_20795, partial [Candidatus Hodarchaeales archaeon]